MKQYGEKKYKVYLYEFPNGKVYVGMTHLSLSERRDCGYHHNKILEQAMRQCGWKAITKHILEDGLKHEEAEQKEIQYIQKFKANDPEFGYNISSGGRKTFEGLHHSEEHKQYMSNVLKGKPFSKEHMEALKNAHVKERRPVVSVDPVTNISTRYESMREAAKAVCGHPTNISRSCDKSNKLYKGFYWRKEA